MLCAFECVRMEDTVENVLRVVTDGEDRVV